jgi:predicted transposase/invertase (TIGR01784 family)
LNFIKERKEIFALFFCRILFSHSFSNKKTEKNVSKKENGFDILPPKVDVVFKMLFGDKRNIEILTAFIEAVLDKKINNVLLLDTTIKKKSPNDKSGIVDVKVELGNGEIVDIEMQARNVSEFRSRISYYSAGMLVEQIGRGGKYSDIKPVISIIIVAQSLIIESNKCHNIFLMLEKDEKFPFNDLQEIHILDLSRIKREENERLSNWLEFINSEKEEEFMTVSQKDEKIKLAYGELKVLSADKKRRMAYEARLREQRDVWAFEDAARLEGIREGRQEGIREGRQEGIREGRQEGILEGRQEGIREGRQERTREILALWEQGIPLSEAKKKLGLK